MKNSISEKKVVLLRLAKLELYLLKLDLVSFQMKYLFVAEDQAQAAPIL